MPPLSVKDLTMPAAAFTMAIVLTAHVYTSIGQARQEADMNREKMLRAEKEKRTARLATLRSEAPHAGAGTEEGK
ncbi:hypothetical protein IAT38_003629 [Cryptococcus sp. DSM 104549]